MRIKIPSVMIKPSTLVFAREARRLRGFSFFDWLHGTVYARWPYLYIGIGTGEHWLSRVFGPVVNRIFRLFKPRGAPNNLDDMQNPGSVGDDVRENSFANSYHGKVVPIEYARQLVMVEEDIKLPDLEKIIPYSKARDIVLMNPDHIVALECPCRVSRSDPCLPLDVCLIVGEPFASYVVEHHEKRARWISQTEAEGILQAEEDRGHVHHAFFKDAMLGRFYAICNCCSCCCGAMQAQRNGTPMLASSGYVAQVNKEKCIACGTCEKNCQFSAIQVTNGYASVDSSLCMGCGVCSTKCSQDAVALQQDLSKGEPLVIAALMEQAEKI